MEPPVPPDEADCCKSCCTPCIFDVYEEQLRKYNNHINNNLMTNGNPSGAPPNCMSETSYAVFKLVQTTRHTGDTYLLTFEYSIALREGGGSCDVEDLSLVYRPGQHFLLRGSSPEYFTRAYTPIPVDNSKLSSLSFTVLVRLYEDGVMSCYIRGLKLGDETLWRGPYGSFAFDNSYRHMLFVAQGTGIAPIFAVIKSLLGDDECEVFLKLFFCCRDGDDILLRDALYGFASHWNFGYEVFLSARGAHVEPQYGEVVNTRRLTDVDLGVYLRDKVGGEKRVQVLICGGEKFCGDIRGHVLTLGVDSSHIFVF